MMKRFGLLCISSVISWPILALTPSVPLSVATVQNKTFCLSEKLPDPETIAGKPIEGTHYISVQTRGGNLLLGPIFGAININSKSNAQAEALKKGISTIDPFKLAMEAPLAKSLLAADPTGAGIEIKPYVIIQLCKDENYRMSLAFQLADLSPKKDKYDEKWIGRYTYHCKTVMTKDQIIDPPPELQQGFHDELAAATNQLFELIEKDRQGALSAEDKRVKVGSLHLVGDITFGNPNNFVFTDCYLQEDRGDAIVFRRKKALLTAAPFMGGLTFGVHLIRKDLLHTFESLK